MSSRTTRLGLVHELAHERAILLEDLNVIVDPVADIDKTVSGYLHAVHRVGELRAPADHSPRSCRPSAAFHRRPTCA